MDRVGPNNHAEGTRDVTAYIVGFYTSLRLHSKLGHRPPNVCEYQIA
jgi:transposase InsO family protein